MTTIDIATKVITPEQKIWLVHAGKRKKYYQIFSKENMVFLDMPGLNLTTDSLHSVEKIRQHIRMSKALGKYFSETNTELNAPSKNPSTYPSNSDDDVRGDVGNIQGLFSTAKLGDLVIVTGYGPYEAVMMGEITTEFDPEDKTDLGGGLYAHVQFRRVKWLSKKYAKKDFPQELAEKKLVNQKAVINIDRTPLTEQLYKYAYSTYIVTDTNNNSLSKVDLIGESYTGQDIRATSSSIDLISYFEAAFIAIERNELEKFVKTDIYTACNKWKDKDLVLSFSQQFNSPGKFQLVSQQAAFIAFLVFGITVFTSDVAAENFTSGVKIENSQNNNQIDKETIEGCKKFQALLSAMGQERVCEIKETANDASKKIGLRTQAKVKK